MKRGRKLPIVLNEVERERLLKQANPRYITGHRNRVIMRTMFNLGLRLSEVVKLRWKDIEFEFGVLMIRDGKGGKDRVLFINDNDWRGEDLKKALLEWKERQAEALGGTPEFVFTSMTRGAEGKQLSDRYIQNMIGRYSRRAELEKKISPHTLRHTFATDLYRKTKDIVTVKNALGHADLSSTMIYITLSGDDLREALSGKKQD